MDNELWRWIWTFGAVAMTLGEITTAGFFMLPFAIGCVLAAIAAWFDGSGGLQWMLFFAGSGISFGAIRMFMGRQDKSDAGQLPVGVQRYVGMDAVVLEAVDAVANTGLIRVETEEWRATVDGDPIDVGATVHVVGLRGTRLLVADSTAGGGETAGGSPAEPDETA
ncbi:MAG TPA: hypothetical protein DEP66_05055 [Acidimicrobiaceae bacterium]|nr:hypothetical protein [Acidimicrobiaceae bacterium]HCB37565.1 hypothetical protein [Acidimicrobiaceae bacterium]